MGVPPSVAELVETPPTMAAVARHILHRVIRGTGTGNVVSLWWRGSPLRQDNVTRGFSCGYRTCPHKLRLFGNRWLMSALPPIADIRRLVSDVGFVPILLQKSQIDEGQFSRQRTKQVEIAH